MTPKAKRSWFDTQMVIITISMAAVLGLWNLFAGPDREAAAQKAAEEFTNQQNQLTQQTEPVIISPAPIAQPVPPVAAPPQPGEKIMLGGSAPQTQIFIQRGGGGGGGSGGGSNTTSTRSS
jgi:hypothetical protein